MLDIGTRADDFAIAKLFKYMDTHDKCGGSCGEIEVDLEEHESMSSYLIRVA